MTTVVMEVVVKDEMVKDYEIKSERDEVKDETKLNKFN